MVSESQGLIWAGAWFDRRFKNHCLWPTVICRPTCFNQGERFWQLWEWFQKVKG